jgi:hypothetical protein
MKRTSCSLLSFLTLGWFFQKCSAQFGAEFPVGCNETQAVLCEQQFLECRLFRGPADDPTTMCECGQEFYGDCIRRAGCQFHIEFDPLGNNEIYEKKCVNHLVKYNCDDTLICGLNCASERNINLTTSKIIPFNNYGSKSLRLRFCDRIVHSTRYEKYATILPVPCETMNDFLICIRWIPPFTFLPVAIPSNTTYMEIDSCSDENQQCEEKPQRVYGNKNLFPSSFNVAQTNVSVCKTDGKRNREREREREMQRRKDRERTRETERERKWQRQR